MQTIVVGYDGSDGAKRALERSVEFARAFGAKLIVVSVAEIPVWSASGAYGVGGAGIALPGVVAPEFAEEPLLGRDPEELVARTLDDARDVVAKTGVEAEYEARGGAPDEAIIELADSRAADLIIVGTREPGFLARILEGSVSADLARRAHCDVLVVHPPHAELRG